MHVKKKRKYRPVGISSVTREDAAGRHATPASHSGSAQTEARSDRQWISKPKTSSTQHNARCVFLSAFDTLFHLNLIKFLCRDTPF